MTATKAAGVSTGPTFRRAVELDSLRGLAALSVLAYHALALNFPQLNASIYLQDVVGIPANLLAYTPLRSLWLGSESVWLFFVLSGFVLTRSSLSAGFRWNAYYPSRLVRLYLPVLGAIALALITYLIPHIPRPGIDAGLATSYPLQAVLQDMTIVGGTSTSLGVLWSLQWEVIFSLLLPVYLLAARRAPVVSSIVAAVLCVGGWLVNSPAASYLPMFFAGVVLAIHWDRLRERLAWAARGGWWNLLAGAVVVLAWCALSSQFLFGRQLEALGLPSRVITLPVVLTAIIVLICAAQVWPPLRGLLSLRAIVFFGTISFSLYLVHLPIVTTAIFTLGPGAAAFLTAAGISLVVAVLFYFGVERPAHRLSRSIGRRIREADDAA